MDESVSLTICYAVRKLLKFRMCVFVDCWPYFLCYQSPEPVSEWDWFPCLLSLCVTGIEKGY